MADLTLAAGLSKLRALLMSVVPLPPPLPLPNPLPLPTLVPLPRPLPSALRLRWIR